MFILLSYMHWIHRDLPHVGRGSSDHSDLKGSSSEELLISLPVIC